MSKENLVPFDKRVAAIMCFPNRARALVGMEVLHELGYRCFERVDLVDTADEAGNTTFVEASKPLPAGGDERTEPSAVLDEIDRAIWNDLDGLAWAAGVFAADEEFEEADLAGPRREDPDMVAAHVIARLPDADDDDD
jgi:hypothetical protein